MENTKEFDVIIVGGSYAGLSAAMALGRSLRSVLVIDGGKPCNRFTPHAHNLITHDGENPMRISEKAKAQVSAYSTVKFHQGLALSTTKTKSGFEVTTDSFDKFSSRKVIFATGVNDILPQISGFEACWGKSIVHCPYCHGFEFKGAKTAIWASGDKAFHLAALVQNLTDHLTIITNDTDFEPDQIAKFKKNRISAINKEIEKIEHKNGNLSSLVFKDGTIEPYDAMYAAVPFEQSCNIPTSMGCEQIEHGYIKCDDLQRTSIDGVFVCGDLASPMRSLAHAIAAGNMAGAAVNAELTLETF